jgi:hypothetical protein
MSLTKCPGCRHLTFVAASSCPSCEQAFQPGSLWAKNAAEERSFGRRVGAVFITALLIMFGVLLFVVLRDYMNGVGPFSS